MQTLHSQPLPSHEEGTVRLCLPAPPAEPVEPSTVKATTAHPSSQQTGPKSIANDVVPVAPPATNFEEKVCATTSSEHDPGSNLKEVDEKNVDAVAESLRQNLASSTTSSWKGSMKKPAACPKKPATCLKKPATCLKKPAAKQKGTKTFFHQKADKPSNALQLRPNGCGKCRQKPGCAPSCWKMRGW